MYQAPYNGFSKSRAFVIFIYLFHSNLLLLTGANSECIFKTYILKLQLCFEPNSQVCTESLKRSFID